MKFPVPQGLWSLGIKKSKKSLSSSCISFLNEYPQRTSLLLSPVISDSAKKTFADLLKKCEKTPGNGSYDLSLLFMKELPCAVELIAVPQGSKSLLRYSYSLGYNLQDIHVP